MTNHWIQSVHLKPGALHRALHIPEGQTIPLREELDILKVPVGEHYHGIPVTAHLKEEVNFAVNVRRSR